MQKKPALTLVPATKNDLEAQAQRLLKDAGVLGLLPTPLDVLAEAAGIKCYAALPDKKGFLETLTESGKNTFLAALQKIRGIADLREKIIYIPEGQTRPKERFAQAHEISHQIIPWHDIGRSLLDTDETLSPDIKVQFENEANFCGADLLFQGNRFKKMARDYTASMDSALRLADLHEVSYQSTLWKFAEVQDEKVCIAQYYPYKERDIITGFKFWRGIGSESFTEKYFDIDLPHFISMEHDWASAITARSPIRGQQDIDCGGQKTKFEWSAWSNTYTLFVMLRRKPVLHGLGVLLPNGRSTVGHPQISS